MAVHTISMYFCLFDIRKEYSTGKGSTTVQMSATMLTAAFMNL